MIVPGGYDRPGCEREVGAVGNVVDERMTVDLYVRGQSRPLPYSLTGRSTRRSGCLGVALRLLDTFVDDRPEWRPPQLDDPLVAGLTYLDSRITAAISAAISATVN